MRVIICGAGHVGLSIAEYLTTEYDVTLIDGQESLLKEAAQRLDLKTIQGSASDPEILEKAGASTTGVIIAVTSHDEVNIVTCQMAASLFHIPLKIARIRSQNYFQSAWSAAYQSQHMPIDVIISPEKEVAEAISQNLKIPQAFDVFPLADGVLKIVGLKIIAKSSLVYTPLRFLNTLFPELEVQIIRIVRNQQIMIPKSSDELIPGDDIYFLARESKMADVIQAFGYPLESSQKFLILGGGKIGLRLADEIEKKHPTAATTVIECSKDRTQILSSLLNNTLILKGDVLDTDLLKEADIDHVDAVIAVTNDDKVNILGSLLAKRYGAKRAVTLVNRKGYFSLMLFLGVDKILNPSALTISTILQRVRKEYVRAVYSLGEHDGEVMDIEVPSTAYAIGFSVQELNIKADFQILAILRPEVILFSFQGVTLKPYDRVIVSVSSDGFKKIKKFFEPRAD